MYRKAGIMGLIICLAIIIAGCSGSSWLKKYNDQSSPIMSMHDPEKDIALARKKVFVLMPFNGTAKNATVASVNDMINRVLRERNAFNIPVSPYEKFKSRVSAKYKASLSKLNPVSGLSDDEKTMLVDLGKKLKINYFYIPVVVRADDDDTPVTVTIDKGDSGGWPSFQVTEMEMSVSTTVAMYLFSTEKGDFAAMMPNTSEFRERYDTNETYRDKINSIRDENNRRRAENRRRKAEYEAEQRKQEEEARQREKEGRDMNVGETIAALASLLDDYTELKMIPNPSFKRLHSDRNSLYTGLYQQSFNNAFGYFISGDFYDGETISGDCINGTGEFKFVNGAKFTGTWKDAKAHGSGELSGKSSLFYKGYFEDGYASGFGEYYPGGNRSNGGDSRFEGLFEKGMKYGTGLYFYNESIPIWIDPWGNVYKEDVSVTRKEPMTLTIIRPGGVYKVKVKNGDFVKWTKMKTQADIESMQQSLREEGKKKDGTQPGAE